MSFKQLMQSYERNDFVAEGDFLFVEDCPSDLVIYAQRGQYTLTKGAQIKSNTLSGRITVENRGEAGQVSLVVGFGEYVPPQKESIAVSAMPAIEVSQLPQMEIAPGQAVSVENLPQTSTQFSSSEVNTPHSFAANSTRKKLIIKASEGNMNAVKVGSFSLLPGERLDVETTASISVSGESTDKIQFIEV